MQFRTPCGLKTRQFFSWVRRRLGREISRVKRDDLGQVILRLKQQAKIGCNWYFKARKCSSERDCTFCLFQLIPSSECEPTIAKRTLLIGQLIRDELRRPTFLIVHFIGTIRTMVDVLV
jgi:hypothetical protein